MFYSDAMATRKHHIVWALRLLWRTRPFSRVRFAVFGVFFFATIGYFGVFSWVIAVLKTWWLQLVVLVVAAGGYLVGWGPLRRYVAFAGHAPHLLAMVRTLEGDKLDRGSAQVEQSTRAVEDKFPETKDVFSLEDQVGKTLKDIRPEAIRMSELKPFPGFNKLGRVSGWMVLFALRYIREAVVGYALHHKHKSTWDSAKRGVVLYAQWGTDLTKSAVRIHQLGVLFGLAVVALLMIPGFRLLEFAGSDAGLITRIVLVAGLVKAAWVVKHALYEPFGQGYMLSSYLALVAGKAVDAELSEQLERASKRYRGLVDRARDDLGVEPPPDGLGDGDDEDKKTGDGREDDAKKKTKGKKAGDKREVRGSPSDDPAGPRRRVTGESDKIVVDLDDDPPKPD